MMGPSPSPCGYGLTGPSCSCQPVTTTATPVTSLAGTVSEVKSAVPAPVPSSVPVFSPSDTLPAPSRVTRNAMLAQPVPVPDVDTAAVVTSYVLVLVVGVVL